MTARLGMFARTSLTLLACVLLTCIPTGVLRVAICTCNGLLVDAHATACPCEAEPDVEPDCAHGCCEATPTPCPHDGDDDSDGACCIDLSMPELLGHAAEADTSSPLAFEVVPWPEPAAPPHLDAPDAGTAELHATGPPDRHRTRRALAARASVVLLI